MQYFILDFNIRSEDTMRKILTGRIEFFLGSKFKEGKSIKAPSLRLQNATLRSKIILDETEFDKESAKETKLMMQNIMIPNSEQNM